MFNIVYHINLIRKILICFMSAFVFFPHVFNFLPHKSAYSVTLSIYTFSKVPSTPRLPVVVHTVHIPFLICSKRWYSVTRVAKLKKSPPRDKTNSISDIDLTVYSSTSRIGWTYHIMNIVWNTELLLRILLYLVFMVQWSSQIISYST